MADINLTNLLMSLMAGSISVPSEFHSRVEAIKSMLSDDLSGLIQSLLDYYVDTASSVNFYVYSGNQNLDFILNNWLEDINVDFMGMLPSGVNALAEEYFKERWCNSSFIVLKLLEWKEYKDNKGNSLNLPSKLAFVDGSLVYVDPKILEENRVSLDKPITYYIGNPSNEKEIVEKLESGIFISKPFDRWFTIYPTPFLIRRGTYHNYLILKAIKEKQGDILIKVLGYFLLLKRGTEEMMKVAGGLASMQNQLQEIKNDLQNLVNEMKTKGEIVPIRFTLFDESIEHVIPDFEKFLKSSLTSATEKAILSSLGWIDVPDSAMSSRRESIINPKPAMEEINKGIRDFSQLLLEVVKFALRENKENHFKYASKKVKVYNSQVTSFLTKDMRDHLRSLYDRGVISKQTYAELVGDVIYVIEKIRRDKEAREGDEIVMYPPVIRNMEADESLIETVRNQDYFVDVEKEENQPEEKQGVEKENFTSSLEEAIYKNINSLPENVKKSIKDKKLLEIWMNVFNIALKNYLEKYNKDEAEIIAFKSAWSVVKKLGKKTKDGWVMKKSEKGGNKNDK